MGHIGNLELPIYIAHRMVILFSFHPPQFQLYYSTNTPNLILSMYIYNDNMTDRTLKPALIRRVDDRQLYAATIANP